MITLSLIAAVMLMTTVAPRFDSNDERPIEAIPMTWQVERQNDPQTGRRTCAVLSLGGDVVARLIRVGDARIAEWSVQIGFENEPGSLRYLRINRTIFQSSERRFQGPKARQIVEQLKLPSEFAYEWFQRPGYAKRAGLFDSGDFAAKAAVCEAWIEGTPT